MYFLIHHSKILIKEQTLPSINMTLKKNTHTKNHIFNNAASSLKKKKTNRKEKQPVLYRMLSLPYEVFHAFKLLVTSRVLVELKAH